VAGAKNCIAVGVLALVIALTSWAAAFASDARAADVRLDGVRATLITAPAATALLFGVGVIPPPLFVPVCTAWETASGPRPLCAVWPCD
jgi:hypothetical protein